MDKRWPTLYIPHGGGPCFFMPVSPGLPPDMWDRLAAYLKGIDAALGRRPTAVLVISGHWETPRPTVNTARDHTLLFDYYGFPDDTYRLTYPAHNAPETVARIEECLTRAGYRPDEDATRGLDHGVFVPFKLIYPEADVPMVQLSLLASLDAAAHVRLGHALAPLRDAGVLIVGSGMSFHNLRAMYAEGPQIDAAARAFDDWLTDAATDPDPERRDAKLARWEEAPYARFCHPREEHLLPLHVAAGAGGGDVGRQVFGEALVGKALSGYQFG
ncbi:MAG: DODA-type extradiol aromatic ring-opening family dioxygenase [Stellaceae bacterium]